MSWLSEIAGKAEDILNRVDKTAATALQNKSKQEQAGLAPDSYTITADSRKLQQDAFQKSSYGKTSNVVSSSSSRSDVYIKKKQNNKPLSSAKINPESDDEKLLQFLNSSEPLPSQSPKKSKTDLFNPVETVTKGSTETLITKTDSVETELGSGNQEETSTVINQSPEEIHIDISESDSSNNLNHESASATSVISSSVPQTYEQQNDVPENFMQSSSLEEELLLTKKRAEHAETEMKRMQKRLEHWNSQISGNDKLVRQLQERERDLITSLDAKDSQLAILKVRLEEADQELESKKKMIEELKVENERCMKDNNENTVLHSKTLDSLREKLLETEAELSRMREAYHAAQTEHMQRTSKMEDEQRHLAESLTNAQKKWSDANERNKELIAQLRNANGNLESLQQEYADYKLKAQRILQSKEKLISSLKEGNLSAEHNDANEASLAMLNAETESIKQERDLLREELHRANDMIATYRSEVQELEKMAQNDAASARELSRNLEEQLQQEKIHKEEIVSLCNQLKEELQYLREDFSRTKSNLQSRIQDRELEIDKLRKQLTAKSLSTVSQDELESRLHALTENLIQKQTLVEALSTEKNSLVLQLERLEQQLKEAQAYGNQHHTVVGVISPDSDRKQKPSVFLENPFDSNLTRRVKRMYGSIDAASIRLGVFFRRYPFARVFILVYVLILHLWVALVLLTYQPEAHASAYGNVQNNKN